MAAAKTPLVLVPGLLCDAAMWQPQLEALGDVAQMQVPDYSDCETLAEAVEVILRACPEGKFSIAGLSMGGYLAAAVALAAPQRVERLALLATRAHALDAPAAIARREQAISLVERGGFEEALAGLMPALLSSAALANPAIAGPVEAMSRRLGPQVFVRQQRANMRRAPIGDQLPGIACPVLVIAGSEDVIAPPAAVAELAALFRHSRFALLGGSGHLCTLEQANEVNALLREWLGARITISTRTARPYDSSCPPPPRTAGTAGHTRGRTGPPLRGALSRPQARLARV